MMKARMYVAASLGALCIGMAGPAIAQQASPGQSGAGASGNATASTTADNGQSLDDIVVTARRVAENLQNVPVAITAYTGEALQAQSVRTLAEVSTLTPGLNFASAQTSQGAVLIQMRGQVQQDTLATLDPSVGTYVDGVYWARAYGLNASLVDIDNFQALKGPQGTLFGRNTSGGAVLINTRDPSFTDGLSGSISGTYGRFNYQNLTAVLNAPLVNDVLAVRLVYAGNKRDGYVTRRGFDLISGIAADSKTKLNNLNDYTVRGKVLFQPTENLRFTLSGEKFHSNTVDDVWHLGHFVPNGLTAQEAGLERLGAAGCFADALSCFGVGNQILAQTLAIGKSPYETWLTVAPENRIDTRTVNLTGTLDTSFGAVKAVGAYRKIRSLYRDTESDGTPARVLNGEGSLSRQEIKQWSGEVTVTGRALADKLDFAVGAFLFDEKGFDATPSSTLTELVRLSPPVGVKKISSQGGNIGTKSWGVYGQGTYHLTDQLSLTGGLRYSSDKKSLASYNGVFLGETLDTAIFICGYSAGCPNRRSATFNSVSYTASIEYKPSEEILVYLKTAKGFRAGGFSLRGSEIAPVSLRPFRPEVVHNYEAGLKSELFDRRLRINLSAYYSTTDDVQRNVQFLVSGQIVTATQNAAKATTWGGELDASLLLPAGFRLDGTAAYAKPKYKKFIDPTGFDRSREPFPFTPSWTATLSPTWEGEASFGKIRARVDFAYQSDMALFAYGTFVAPNGTITDSTSGAPLAALTGSPGTVVQDAAAFAAANTDKEHVLVNARIGATVADGRLDLAVWGKNLTNLRDRISALVIPALGSASVRLREPRTYGVTATVTF